MAAGCIQVSPQVSTAFEHLFNETVFTKYDFSSELLCWLLTYVFIENTYKAYFLFRLFPLKGHVLLVNSFEKNNSLFSCKN